MDFIVELPVSNGYNAVYVIVDRLSKMAHFLPTTTKVSAKGTAELFLQIFKMHGFPDDIVSDRGPQFTSKFWSSLLKMCGVHPNRSTAFHPQSDGQTERVNQILEQYLRMFCNYQQSNWAELLPLAEFAYNNTEHSSTKFSPFFANYGYHPNFDLQLQPPNNSTPVNPAAQSLTENLRKVHEQMVENLKAAQDKYKRNHDVYVKESPEFQVGDRVWLLRRNIKTTRPSTKLDYRRLGPFRITEIVGQSQSAFRLELPPQMHIHPVFHVSLLEPYIPNIIPGRTQDPPEAVEVEGQEEWEVGEVLDSKIQRGALFYLVDWEGFGPEDRTWEPAINLENSTELVEAFHLTYPNRPSPEDLPKPRRARP